MDGTPEISGDGSEKTICEVNDGNTFYDSR